MERVHTVNLTALGEAEGVAKRAAQHYGGLAEEFAGNVTSLRDGQALDGGFGMTGMFQSLLSEFGREWLLLLDQFVAEERALAAFLQGFAVKLGESHQVYQDTESRVAQSFDDIARSIERRER